MLEYCCYCGIELLKSGTEILINKPLTFPSYKKRATLHPQSKTREHVYPKSLGVHPVKRLYITLSCCYACNSEKMNLTLREYVDKLKKANSEPVKIRNVENLIVIYEI